MPDKIDIKLNIAGEMNKIAPPQGKKVKRANIVASIHASKFEDWIKQALIKEVNRYPDDALPVLMQNRHELINEVLRSRGRTKDNGK